MKKKLKLKFEYDSPVMLTFAFITLIIFILDTFVFKGKLKDVWLITPTATGGQFPFAFSDFRSIIRLFIHVFGYDQSSVLVCNLIFILLLGPQMEDRYGSVIIGIMIFVSALFSGVLNACFCTNAVSGSEPVVFMLILLWTMMQLSRSKISASAIAVIALFITMLVFRKNPNGVVGVAVVAAGGLCGSLFAFLASPKARKAKKNEAALAEFRDESSPRFSIKSTGKGSAKSGIKSGNKKSYDDSEETVIGSIEL